MLVIPAIDLLDNQAVRLFQGEYEKKTVYSNDPWTLVSQFQDAGAELIHLVDLNGAKEGRPGNQESIKKIKNEIHSSVKLELGGGIRTMETLAIYDDLGVDRFILGTAAVTNPGFVDQALARYGKDRIVIGVDAKDGFVKTQGWEKDVGLRYEDFMDRIFKQGIAHVIFTDISLDGTLQGPNFMSYSWILKHFPFFVIASGGVSSLEDLDRLASLNQTEGEGVLFGAITGKAIYENRIDLKKAVEYCNQKER